MEKSKFTSFLWCIISLAVVLSIAAVTIDGLSGNTVSLVNPSILAEAAERTLECAKTGDFSQLRKMLSGTPQLGTPCGNGDSAEDLLWKAYLDSIQYDFPGTYDQSEALIELDVQISCLDISSAVEKMGSPVLKPGQSRQEALRDAAALVLSDAPPTMTRAMKLQLTRSGNDWQVILNPPLQQLLSGFVSE